MRRVSLLGGLHWLNLWQISHVFVWTASTSSYLLLPLHALAVIFTFCGCGPVPHLLQLQGLLGAIRQGVNIAVHEISQQYFFLLFALRSLKLLLLLLIDMSALGGRTHQLRLGSFVGPFGLRGNFRAFRRPQID